MTLRTDTRAAARQHWTYAAAKQAGAFVLCIAAAHASVRADAGVDAGALDSGATGAGGVGGDNTTAGGGGTDAGSPTATTGAGGTGGGGGTEGAGMLDAGAHGSGADSGSQGGASSGGGLGGDGGSNGLDASSGAGTAACSCETKEGAGAREVHVCTGSFDPAVCGDLICTEGKRYARCDDDSPVKLCCEMKARRLYSYLYEDCTHPNCEAGFRAQCSDLGGQVHAGLCEMPVEPSGTDDESGSASDDGACAIGVARADGKPGTFAYVLGVCALSLTMRRRRRS